MSSAVQEKDFKSPGNSTLESEMDNKVHTKTGDNQLPRYQTLTDKNLSLSQHVLPQSEKMDNSENYMDYRLPDRDVNDKKMPQCDKTDLEKFEAEYENKYWHVYREVMLDEGVFPNEKKILLEKIESQKNFEGDPGLPESEAGPSKLDAPKVEVDAAALSGGNLRKVQDVKNVKVSKSLLGSPKPVPVPARSNVPRGFQPPVQCYVPPEQQVLYPWHLHYCSCNNCRNFSRHDQVMMLVCPRCYNTVASHNKPFFGFCSFCQYP